MGSATPVQVSVFVADPNPGPVIITWDFGDGTTISKARTGTKFRMHKNQNNLRY